MLAMGIVIFIIVCIIANIVLSLSGSRIIKSKQHRYVTIILLDAFLLIVSAIAGSILCTMLWLVMLCMDAVKLDEEN